MHILEEEERSKPEKVEEPPALTLKEFLDSFTEDENKEVQGVQCLFEDYNRDILGESGILKKSSVSLDENDIKIEMDEVLMKKLVSGVQVAMPWENWDSMSKVIEDGSYMILENRMSNLKAFTKVEDITTSLLLNWFQSFTLAKYADFEINFLIDHLTKLVRVHFGLRADLDVHVDLNLAGLGYQVVAKQRAVIDSKQLATIKRDGATDDLGRKIDSMQLVVIELDEAIEELEKEKKKRKKAGTFEDAR
ncbi:hypothetical protein ACSBR1_034616 [Camellia fascicularis]